MTNRPGVYVPLRALFLVLFIYAYGNMLYINCVFVSVR